MCPLCIVQCTLIQQPPTPLHTHSQTFSFPSSPAHIVKLQPGKHRVSLSSTGCHLDTFSLNTISIMTFMNHALGKYSIAADESCRRYRIPLNLPERESGVQGEQQTISWRSYRYDGKSQCQWYESCKTQKNFGKECTWHVTKAQITFSFLATSATNFIVKLFEEQSMTWFHNHGVKSRFLCVVTLFCLILKKTVVLSDAWHKFCLISLPAERLQILCITNAFCISLNWPCS